jgi:hypothetical protein
VLFVRMNEGVLPLDVDREGGGDDENRGGDCDGCECGAVGRPDVRGAAPAHNVTAHAAPQESEAMCEERRVAYVGMSRAADALHCVYIGEFRPPGAGAVVRLEPSRFLAALLHPPPGRSTAVPVRRLYQYALHPPAIGAPPSAPAPSKRQPGETAHAASHGAPPGNSGALSAPASCGALPAGGGHGASATSVVGGAVAGALALLLANPHGR